jgi:hypothetical protein
LVNRLFAKGTCDEEAALFASLVKDVQDEILGFEVCSVGQWFRKGLSIYHIIKKMNNTRKQHDV